MDLALHLLDNLHDILGIVRHALFELKLPLDISLLMELHVARLKEMGVDRNVAFNFSLPNDPPRNPFPSHEVVQLNIFAGDSDVHVEGLLSQVHKHYL